MCKKIALPQADTGFAAGVAACVGAAERQMAALETERVKRLEQGKARPPSVWYRSEELRHLLIVLRALSPQPEDKGLRGALSNLLAACQGVDGYEGLDEARQDAWKQLSTQEKQG